MCMSNDVLALMESLIIYPSTMLSNVRIGVESCNDHPVSYC